MADTAEMAEIRGLDIDKLIKGYALRTYIFKNLVTVSTTNGDSIRWYKETAGDLTTTPPQQIETSPLSTFTYLEPSWTRTTSYPRKYAVTAMLSREMIKDADIDVLGRSILRLTRAVIKAVDTRIIDVLTNRLNGYLANSGAAVGKWDTPSANCVGDILSGLQAIAEDDYPINNLSLVMTPKSYHDLLSYTIETKGSSIPQFASQKVESGSIQTFMGLKVVVSNNMISDYVLIGDLAKMCTWKEFEPLHAETENVLGLGTRIAVWENGEALLTDENAGYIIKDVDT